MMDLLHTNKYLVLNEIQLLLNYVMVLYELFTNLELQTEYFCNHEMLSKPQIMGHSVTHEEVLTFFNFHILKLRD